MSATAEFIYNNFIATPIDVVKTNEEGDEAWTESTTIAALVKDDGKVLKALIESILAGIAAQGKVDFPVVPLTDSLGKPVTGALVNGVIRMP